MSTRSSIAITPTRESHLQQPVSLGDQRCPIYVRCMVLALAQTYFLLFGLLSIMGGIIGFSKAKSRASLIAGSVAGILLIFAAFLVKTPYATEGLILSMVLSLALAGRFLPSFLKTKKAMPAGMMSILSVIGIVVTLVAWLERRS
jgi:uncharacterized membrane protein (UPF0136 family)